MAETPDSIIPLKIRKLLKVLLEVGGRHRPVTSRGPDLCPFETIRLCSFTATLSILDVVAKRVAHDGLLPAAKRGLGSIAEAYPVTDYHPAQRSLGPGCEPRGDVGHQTGRW